MEEKLSTIEKFIDPSQWMVWKFQIRVNLMAAEIFNYVDGTKQKPSDEKEKDYDKNIVEWTKNDAKAQKIIVNSCGSKILIHLCNCSTADQMWKKLHSVFEQSNEAAKQLLQEKFFAHISTLEGLVQKLKGVKVDITESMLISKILMTLPDEYRHFPPAWDSTSSAEKTLSNLTNRLLIEESCLGSHSMDLNEIGSSEALLAKQNGSATGKRNAKHHNKTVKPKQRGKCFKCGSDQHWKRDCKEQSPSEKSQSTSKTGKAFFSSIVQSLAKRDAWYVDSGASSHMCNRRDWFVSYKNLDEPVEVLLGNGDKMKAIGSGDLNILSFNGKNWIEKKMINVLYAPKLYAKPWITDTLVGGIKHNLSY